MITLKVNKTTFAAFIAIPLLLILFPGSANAQTADPNEGIIPAPASLVKSASTFTFSKQTVIKADKPKDETIALLKDFLLNNRGLKNKVIKYSPKTKGGGSSLILTSRGAESLPKEGYKLIITTHKAIIIGKGAGLFYGLQTFMQLFPVAPEPITKLPCLTIADEPRFGYRGMMLDVSRHFFTVPQVKKVLDLMAAYKLNNFHWHLVRRTGMAHRN